MKFLYPEFLWALSVLILPILIHLFNFKRYKTLYFSSLNFVRQVDQQTKSAQRLKHYIILASRLLAFLFLVFAFAQPYFPDEKEAGASKESVLAFYIDNSFSMQAVGADGELLSQARENALSIIEKAPLDTRFLIGTNEMTGAEERFLTKVEALEKLDQIALSPLSRSPAEILNWQLEVLKTEADEDRSTQYVFLSDFQKGNGLKSTKVQAKNVSFFPIKLSPQNEANIFIDSLWFSSPVHKVGAANELNIRISNSSANALENVEVEIQIDAYRKTLFVSLPAREKTVTQVSYADKSKGLKKGSVKVVDAEVLFDDEFYLSYEVVPQLNVLLLDGEDAIPNFATVYGLDAFYNFRQQAITSITKDDFQSTDLVIVNGSNDLSRGVSNYLIDFVSTGGSVGLFPGKNPARNDWNYLLEKLRLSPMSNAVATGNGIDEIAYDDPFFSGVFEKKTDKLNLPSVTQSFRASETGASLASPLITLQNGLPLFSASKTNGTAFMFYSAVHPDFGNFAKNALFSTLLLRMGEVSQRTTPDFLFIGDQGRYPIYRKIQEDSPVRIRNGELEIIPHTFNVAGIHYISLNLLSDYQQLLAGNYEILNGDVVGNVSLNYNRKESDLTAFDEDAILDFFKTSGANKVTFNEIGRDSDLSTIDIDKPFSYWKICIVLTLIFVMLEMALVRFLK
jgi:hypothetical protein